MLYFEAMWGFFFFISKITFQTLGSGSQSSGVQELVLYQSREGGKHRAAQWMQAVPGVLGTSFVSEAWKSVSGARLASGQVESSDAGGDAKAAANVAGS